VASYEKPFSALLAGVSDRLKKKHPIGALTPAERVDGKTCLVTGANSGLGKAIAVELARRGGRIVMACRSGHPAAGESVKRESGNSCVEMARIDLTDFDSIRVFCKEMKRQRRCFDIVVLNAGIVAACSRRTKQGFEEMFGVNYLANFLLVNRLLRDGTIPNSVFTGRKDGTASPGGDAGLDTSGSARIPRIVFVSSEAHRTSEPIDFTTLGQFRDYGMNGSLKEYGFTKLCLTAFAVELARRLRTPRGVDVAVHALCPGIVNTNIAREAPGWIQPIMKIVFPLFAVIPSSAAEPAIYLSCARSLEGRTRIYLHLMNEKEPAPHAVDPETGRQLWVQTEDLIESGPLS
jgi:NAD(P)-dependent dehydrogenase (short-subunit alcohol dehydrogenase family)